METIIEVKNLNMSYERVEVLHGVSFDIGAGEWLSIVGENGSGKTTLLKGIAGLLPIKSGEIKFGGGVTRKTIGYLPQQTAIQRDFPACVHEVVLSGCTGANKILGLHSAADKKRAHEAIHELGIEAIHHRPYCDLSGGQQQRVLLARAFCATQKLLLLDEPVTGLDPMISAEMYASIKLLNEKHGVAVIMVSHDIAGAVKYSDKILHIGHKVEFFGTTDEYKKTELGRRFVVGE